MFVRHLDESVSLALVQAGFAKRYYQIVCREREYLSQWLAWPIHANGEAFFSSFITSALHDYAEGKEYDLCHAVPGRGCGERQFQ